MYHLLWVNHKLDYGVTPSPQTMKTSEDHALIADQDDELSHFRDEFYIPRGKVYLDGNSLGLLSKKGEEWLDSLKDEWKELAIEGWTGGEIPWFFLAETLGERMATLVGAKPKEVIATGTTTVNIHSLVSTLYEPKEGRDKILADELNFPSDIYALEGILELKGYDPNDKLLMVPSDDGHTLDEDRIVDMMEEDVCIAHLPSVLYRSGQLLDMEYLTKEAHKRDIIIGFDCSHSAGVIPHDLHGWGVDYAMWCGYKYLNGGPGCSAFLYIHEDHFQEEPKLKGWFGYQKDKQFELSLDFIHEESAGGWQISSPSILGSGALIGSLEIIDEAGLVEMRRKSMKMTDYFIDLVECLMDGPSYGIEIVTPKDAQRRSSHVALTHEYAGAISSLLRERGFIPDYRPPNIIRIAFSPLYNTYHDAWRTAMAVKDIIECEKHLDYENEGERLVT